MYPRHPTLPNVLPMSPFSDGVPVVPAEGVNVATINPPEPARLTEKVLTTSVPEEVVNTAMAQPVTSIDAGLHEDQLAPSSVGFSPHVNSDIEPGD